VRSLPGRMSTLGPRIALWGVFDTADYARLLVPRILERELRSRLPLARIDSYAPLGFEHPIPMDGGRPALPLGVGSARRKRDLAQRYDVVVVTGDVVHTRDDGYRELYGHAFDLRPSEFFVDGLGAELEERCPVIWSAVGVPFEPREEDMARLRSALERRPYVSVRDDASRRRLEELGTERAITVVPDPVALAPRVFDPDVLRKRLDYLRVLGCYPTEGRPVVVDVDAVDAEAAAKRFSAEPIVFVYLRPSSAERQLQENVFHLPPSATLEDITAAIASASAFVGPPEAPRLATGFDAADRKDLEVRVDAELDTIAEIAERAWSEHSRSGERLEEALLASEERYAALLSAYEARGERLVTERMRFAEIVDRLDESGGSIPPEAASRIAELENAVFTAQAAEAEARYELERLRKEREAIA
jgi:Polysaccharide pyruvyl transferase